MADIKIRPKIQIARKQKAGFSFNERIIVTLSWATVTDLDLCIFFKTKDGKESGVFSNEYRGRKSDLGFIDKFPFIKHSGDDKEPVPGAESSEEIKIAKLDDIESAYILIVNYTAAKDEESVTFAEHSGKVVLRSDNEDQSDLEINVDSNDEGQVYYVGKISKDGIAYVLSNECKVMYLGDAFDEIPGFNLITKS
jgi:uncharacterized protein involved in tellurium resistance